MNSLGDCWVMEHLPYSGEMSLNKTGIKVVLHAAVDLEASQSTESPSPSRTCHVMLPSVDREGWGALVYPLLRASLLSPCCRTKISLWEKSCSFPGFMMPVLNVLMEKLKSTFSVSDEKVGLTSIFVTTVTKFMWTITGSFPGNLRTVVSNMSHDSSWTYSICSMVFWERGCAYSSFGH